MDDTAAEANVTAAEANVTAAEANVTAAKANVTAADSNAITAKANAIAAEANAVAAEEDATETEEDATETEEDAIAAEEETTETEEETTETEEDATETEEDVIAAEEETTETEEDTTAAVADATAAEADALRRSGAQGRTKKHDFDASFPEHFAVARRRSDMPNTAKPANTDSKPDHPWDSISQAALKATKLATDHAAALGSRIPTAFLAQFAADIASLGVAVPTTMTTKKSAVQLTAAQNAALRTGHKVAMGIRKAVRGQASPEIQLAYGIGTKVEPKVIKSVRSGLDTIGKRLAAQPAEAASFGITTDDAAAVTSAIAAIDAAYQAQTTARATSPATTKARNATARRLLAGIQRISGAGMRVFASDPTLYDAFASLTEKAA